MYSFSLFTSFNCKFSQLGDSKSYRYENTLVDQSKSTYYPNYLQKPLFAFSKKIY